MADRVSVSIAIGGDLPANLVDEFIETVESERLSTDWNGPAFDISQVPPDDALRLYAYEVASGELDQMESFCIEHGLAFSRWSGACIGAFGAEIITYDGQGPTRRFDANEDERAIIDVQEAAQLGSYEAILAHFAAAEIAIPPLTIVGPQVPAPAAQIAA